MLSRRFTIVSLSLVATVAFLIGTIVAGGFARPSVRAGDAASDRAGIAKPKINTQLPTNLVDFADVVERINPAVVNIDATARRDGRVISPQAGATPDKPDPHGTAPFRQMPHRGAGSGFIIDPDGTILTNHHVIEHATHIVVTLADGRRMKARVVGADPDTDVALIKVDSERRLPAAALGDSSTLRPGEWVCAIGNPLGYQHSVTVGVVSFIGRKLFDPSLDNYIQTDAAISFGNSGGPLINARGEVIGINTAISSRATNIGFAVPINGATEILPQLKDKGRVVRGYLGVRLREMDPDLQASLRLPVTTGALVQDVSEASPAARAGIRPYDIITSFNDTNVSDDEALIRWVSGRPPGTAVTLRVFRDGREQTFLVKLAERPKRQGAHEERDPTEREQRREPADAATLGLTVRDLDATAFNRLNLPGDTRGVLITRVEPLSASASADVRRNTVLLEINRAPVRSAADFQRIAGEKRAGDILTLYIYSPDLDTRELKTVHVEER
jgi:serine protease Do